MIPFFPNPFTPSLSMASTKFSMEQWEQKLAAVQISKEDMNKLIMNFLVTEGHVEAARTFARESGTATTMDLSSIQERMEVRRAVQSGNVDEAIEKVNDMNPEVRALCTAVLPTFCRARLVLYPYVSCSNARFCMLDI